MPGPATQEPRERRCRGTALDSFYLSRSPCPPSSEQDSGALGAVLVEGMVCLPVRGWSAIRAAYPARRRSNRRSRMKAARDAA